MYSREVDSGCVLPLFSNPVSEIGEKKSANGNAIQLVKATIRT
jgi:hypothetical protein